MRAVVAALVLLAAASTARAEPTAQVRAPDTTRARDPWIWPGAGSTPEATLQLYRVGQDMVSGHARVRFKALALGFPSATPLVLWGFRLGADCGVCLQSGFVADSAGHVVCDPASVVFGDTCAACTLPLDQIVLTATGYAAGEPYRLGVISPDGHFGAYAETIPVPVVSEADSFRLHLEMVRADGLEVEHVVEARDAHAVRGRQVERVGDLLECLAREPAVALLRQAKCRQDRRLRFGIPGCDLADLVYHRSVSPMTASSDPTIAIRSATSVSCTHVAVASSATSDGARKWTRQGFGAPSETR